MDDDQQSTVDTLNWLLEGESVAELSKATGV